MPFRRLEDVRPGDLYLGPIGGLVGAGVRLGQLVVDGGWRVGQLDVRHIGVVVEAAKPGLLWAEGRYSSPPRLAQAMPGGAEIVDMTYEKHWNARCAYARIPEDYPGQAEDAAAIARLMVAEGVGYSYASYAALALYHYGLRAPRLTEWIGRRRESVTLERVLAAGQARDVLLGLRLPCEAICSVFADQAWSLAGKRVMQGTAPQAVTPSMLANRLLKSTEGVIWAWPEVWPGVYLDNA